MRSLVQLYDTVSCTYTLKQAVVAAGDGCIGAMSIDRLLDRVATQARQIGIALSSSSTKLDLQVDNTILIAKSSLFVAAY